MKSAVRAARVVIRRMDRVRHAFARWKLIAQGADVGRRARVSPSAVVRGPQGLVVGDDVAIGDFVHIWAGGGIAIGADSLIAAHCSLASQSHAVDAVRSGLLFRNSEVTAPITIGRNVWIASSVTISAGVTIGDNCIVGAGSVVLSDIPPNCLAVGAPARVIRKLTA
ncbi:MULTISPECIES: acyltransferase [unclassified Microbacterium]|uniref:acyltransferase n=1 Tax=unclassified Microbacterium TaxID=2609290 RepID=UPI00214C6FD2|nr:MULTISPECIES: acyltransferase [unclassified Microbacterium]MCR2808901.1 acyltransferase [Microbacterium sp. zg.B185]WIM18680.1 acyltransferase [Microbacterium sp. zg-B185]